VNGKLEEAEQSLERAFALNPGYPFGHLLRGQLRAAEGEVVGARLLFRRAAELYAPQAHEPLAFVHELIADTELKLNRPIAARAALKRAALFAPGNSEVRQAIEALFGPKARFPAVACKDYVFQRPAAASANWDRALADAATGRLGDVQRVFQLWTKKHPEDAAAWFNLGLIEAWLGNNVEGVEALAKYVEIEPDEGKAGNAWAMAEVLRCGQGLESEADWVEHRAVFAMRDPGPVVPWLQEWERSNRLRVLGSDQEMGVLSALILEEATSLLLSGSAAPPARLGSYVLIAGNILQFWHPVRESLERVLAEVQKLLGPAIGEPERAIAPIHFGDVVAEALLFPTAATTQLDVENKIRSHTQQFFEETWINRPLKSLLGLTPIDAMSRATLRKRVRGVVRFIEDCAAQTTIRLYDFDRLRQRLGLDGAPPSAVSVGPTTDRSTHGESKGDPAATDMRPGESDLEEAFREALKEDNEKLASHLARQLIERAPSAGGDRFPQFSHLIKSAQAAGEFDAALELVDAGEKSDCESNEGRRRNEYELRRGQLLAKRGDASAALDTFDRLLARVPDELKIAGAASEAMLAIKNGAAARRFAEHGLQRARDQKDRDMEGYFLELADAAQRIRG
jgi:tetratricopeptide (TPR) repeat protein